MKNKKSNEARLKANPSTARRRTLRNAQMEIMGLAIIIILVALAMLFVVQFVVLRQPSETKKTVTHKEIASNTIITLLDTTTECRGLSIAQLLENCAEGGYIQCTGTKNSCIYAEEVIQEILDNTLTAWNKEYYLTIKVEDDNIAGSFGKPCPAAKTSSSPCCQLSTGIGTMSINIDICG